MSRHSMCARSTLVLKKHQTPPDSIIKNPSRYMFWVSLDVRVDQPDPGTAFRQSLRYLLEYVTT